MQDAATTDPCSSSGRRTVGVISILIVLVAAVVLSQWGLSPVKIVSAAGNSTPSEFELPLALVGKVNVSSSVASTAPASTSLPSPAPTTSITTTTMIRQRRRRRSVQPTTYPIPPDVPAHVWVEVPSAESADIIVRVLQSKNLLLDLTNRSDSHELFVRKSTSNSSKDLLRLRLLIEKASMFDTVRKWIRFYHGYREPIIELTPSTTGFVSSSSSSSSSEQQFIPFTQSATTNSSSSFSSSYNIVDISSESSLYGRKCNSFPAAARSGNSGCIRGDLTRGNAMFQRMLRGVGRRQQKRSFLWMPGEDGTGKKDMWVNWEELTVDGSDLFGRTALQWAAWRGDADVVAFLIEHLGAQVNFQPPYSMWQDLNGNSALMLAAWRGRETVVSFLINKARANVTLASPQGQIALHWAGRMGRSAVAKQLLAASASSVDVADSEGWSALHWAAEYGRAGVAEVLLDHGAEPGLKSKEKWTPLHRAASMGKSRCQDAWRNRETINSFMVTGDDEGHAAVVKLLIRRLAAAGEKSNNSSSSSSSSSSLGVNAADINGRTPLHVAAEFGTEEVVDVLLKNGASIKAVDSFGLTALHYAVRRGNSRSVVQMLLQAAGPLAPSLLAAKDVDGFTVFDVAKRHRRNDLIDVLLNAKKGKRAFEALRDRFKLK